MEGRGGGGGGGGGGGVPAPLHSIRANDFGTSGPAHSYCLYGEAMIISLARIQRENVHVVCSTVLLVHA